MPPTLARWTRVPSAYLGQLGPPTGNLGSTRQCCPFHLGTERPGALGVGPPPRPRGAGSRIAGLREEHRAAEARECGVGGDAGGTPGPLPQSPWAHSPLSLRSVPAPGAACHSSTLTKPLQGLACWVAASRRVTTYGHRGNKNCCEQRALPPVSPPLQPSLGATPRAGSTPFWLSWLVSTE